MKRTLLTLGSIIGACGLSAPAFADTLNSGDTAWILTATALVLFEKIRDRKASVCRQILQGKPIESIVAARSLTMTPP